MLAVLFASLPVASKLFLGVWGFDGAAEMAFLCALLGTYFHLISRGRSAAIRDTAAMLDQALQLAREGQTRHAIATLTEAIRLGPHVWQAFQYRGELRLLEGETAAALEDFTEAIRLAPGERHLLTLRDRARQILVDARPLQDSPVEPSSPGSP